MSEHVSISLHEIQVYRYVSSTKRWVSNKEIAEAVNVASRTVRYHTSRLVALGIFDQADVFPGYRYRLSLQAENRNKAYLLRLAEAEQVFRSSEDLEQ